MQQLRRQVEELRAEMREMRAERARMGEMMRERMRMHMMDDERMPMRRRMMDMDDMDMPVMERERGGAMGLALFLTALHEPELAGLTAMETARRTLDHEQRVDFFRNILDRVNEPPMIRNAAYLGLIEALTENDEAPDEVAELLERMVTENAYRWEPNPSLSDRLGGGDALRSPHGPIVTYRLPPGRHLERDLRSPRFYQYDPFYRYWQERQPADPRFLPHRHWRDPLPHFPYTDPHW